MGISVNRPYIRIQLVPILGQLLAGFELDQRGLSSNEGVYLILYRKMLHIFS